MGLMGMISDEMKLPLCSMSDDNIGKLKKELKSYQFTLTLRGHIVRIELGNLQMD